MSDNKDKVYSFKRVNPFGLLIRAWGIACLFSLLEFSDYFKIDQISDLIFLISLLLFMAILAKFYNYSNKNKYIVLDQLEIKNSINSFSRIGILSLLAATLEFYVQGIPILNNISYSEFGLPVIHVFVYGIAIVWAVYAPLLLYTGHKKVGYTGSFLILFYSVLIISRHLLLIYIISFSISYLSLKKYKIRKILFLGIVTIFVFGEIGTLRMSYILNLNFEDARDYILINGGASEIFRDLNVPVSFFWFWLYIASPIYNLVYNYQIYPLFDINTISVINTLSQLIPETISKRMIDSYRIQFDNTYLIADNLTASTALARIYIAIGIIGPYLYLMYAYLLNNFFLIISNNNLRKVLIEKTFGLILILSIFDNMLTMPSFWVALLIFYFIAR